MDTKEAEIKGIKEKRRMEAGEEDEINEQGERER